MNESLGVGSTATLSQIFVQNIFEDSFKIPIAQWVYKRVEGGVHVTEPYGEHVQVMVHAVSTERHDHKAYKVRDPTQQESCDDEAQLPGCLVLLVDPQAVKSLTGLFEEPSPCLPQSHLIVRVQLGVLSPFGPGQRTAGVVLVAKHGRVPLHLADITNTTYRVWHCDVTVI